MVESILRDNRGVDILINITGGPPAGEISSVDAGSLRPHVDAMVLSVIDITNRLLPGKRSRRWGRIITSTSSGVAQPIPNLGVSHALRDSLVTWSKTLGTEVAADGVTANVVVPGRIKTRRVDELDQKAAERLGQPVENVVRESIAMIPAAVMDNRTNSRASWRFWPASARVTSVAACSA
jgi:3-oxoacyl-[acyl-carrier protein] reductase